MRALELIETIELNLRRDELNTNSNGMIPAANTSKKTQVPFRLSQFSICVLVVALSSLGCRLQPPGGQPIEPNLLGSVVDEANRTQEENAEASKFIIYMHEFEPNTPNHAELLRGQAQLPGEFEYQTENRIQGFRLNPDGQDHVRQIARHLLANQTLDSGHGYLPNRQVVVERSDTSKLWRTVHRFPVHYNDELDAARRNVVVNALAILGVANADQIVVVAPAFPEGLNADEASRAFGRGFNYRGQIGGGFGGGGFGGGGFGGGGFGGGGFGGGGFGGGFSGGGSGSR